MAGRRNVVAMAAVLATALISVAGLAVVPDRAAAAGRFSSSAWVPYWQSARAVREIKANRDVLPTASMFWYDARSCSSIVGYPGAGNRRTISSLRSRGVKVIATVTASGLRPGAATACFASATKRAAHIRRLVRIVTSRNYAGLDLDYEHLALTTSPRTAAKVRSAYSTFVTSLCARLRTIDKKCIITVMPRTSDASPVWRGKLVPAAYDFAALGAAATTLRVMAYDQHAGSYGPGPIAGWPWVKKIMAYTAGKVRLNKVELGVPTYGRDFARGRSSDLIGNQAVALAKRVKAKPRYDRVQREWTFSYRSRGVRHTVWFSSPRAVADRTRLARRAGMSGAAYWAAGLDQVGTWRAVRKRG